MLSVVEGFVPNSTKTVLTMWEKPRYSVQVIASPHPPTEAGCCTTLGLWSRWFAGWTSRPIELAVFPLLVVVVVPSAGTREVSVASRGVQLHPLRSTPL